MTSDPMIRFRCVALRRSGATDIRIVHAANADAARDRLIAAALEPVTIEAVGPSLTDRLAARLLEGPGRLRHVLPDAPKLMSQRLLTSACFLATASISLMLGSWALVLVTMWKGDHILREKAASIASYREHRADERVRILARPAMTTPGPTETLGRLAAILPSDTDLVGAARDPKGALRIELDTSDPDQIRPIFAGDPNFRSLKEISQTQTDEAMIRVIWTSTTP